MHLVEDNAKFNTHKVKVLDKNRVDEYIASLEFSNRNKDLKLQIKDDEIAHLTSEISRLEQLISGLDERITILEA